MVAQDTHPRERESKAKATGAPRPGVAGGLGEKIPHSPARPWSRVPHQYLTLWPLWLARPIHPSQNLFPDCLLIDTHNLCTRRCRDL